MKSKIVITLDEEIDKQLDFLIMQQSYSNRSQAIEEAVSEKLDRLKRGRHNSEKSQHPCFGAYIDQTIHLHLLY